MIKPDGLWALMKTGDVATIGRVCAALGKQDVPDLNAAERALVEVIKTQSGWYDENKREMQERERLRKEEYRRRKAEEAAGCCWDRVGESPIGDIPTESTESETDGEVTESGDVVVTNVPQCPTGQNGTTDVPRDNLGQGDVPQCPRENPESALSRTYHPSYHPTIHPTTFQKDKRKEKVKKETETKKAFVQDGTEPTVSPRDPTAEEIKAGCRANPNETDRTRTSPAPLDELKLYSRHLGIPEEYYKRFLEQMHEQNWAYINKQGVLVPVTRANYKTIIGSFWRYEKSKAANGGVNGNATGTLQRRRDVNAPYVESGLDSVLG